MIIFRPAVPEDVPLVRDSFWRGALRSDCAPGASIPFLLRRFAELNAAGWDITIACDDGAPSEILGWIMGLDRSRVAWVYVKEEYRKANVARRLYESLPEREESRGDVYAPFVTLAGKRFAERLGRRVLFRPFLEAK